MLRKVMMEFIGTFFFVLVIGQVVIGTEGLAAALAPVAIGSALMVVVYAGGHVSGGHYNPAVTLAVWIRGKTATAELVPYWIAQILGAVLAALVVGYFKAGVDVVPMELDVVPALLAEFLFTFALCFVVLNVATADATAGNSYFGLAIGFAVLIGAYAVGGISGGAFNPAVAAGITAMGLSTFSNIWIFLVANLLGGAAAGYAFNSLGLSGAETVKALADAPELRTEPAGR